MAVGFRFKPPFDEERFFLGVRQMLELCEGAYDPDAKDLDSFEGQFARIMQQAWLQLCALHNMQPGQKRPIDCAKVEREWTNSNLPVFSSVEDAMRFMVNQRKPISDHIGSDLLK